MVGEHLEVGLINYLNLSKYMNIEKYAKVAPQFYTGEIPIILYNLLFINHFSVILDCGCGDGSLLHAIIKAGLVKKSEIHAVDLSKDRIVLIKKLSHKIIAKVDSAETLKSIKSNTIDLLVTTQVIEHVDDKKMELTLKRVIKKGGIVYLSTVFKKWYGWYFYKNDIGWVIDPTHLREYSKDSQLINILKKDFVIVENKKTLQWFPIVDFFSKRINFGGKRRDGYFWRFFRSIRIPVFGYYNWEIVMVRK